MIINHFLRSVQEKPEVLLILGAICNIIHELLIIKNEIARYQVLVLVFFFATQNVICFWSLRFWHSTISSERTPRSRNKLYEINDCYGNSLFLFAIGWNKKSPAINSQLARGKAVARLVYALSPKKKKKKMLTSMFSWKSSFLIELPAPIMITQSSLLAIYRKPCCKKRNRNHEFIQSCR